MIPARGTLRKEIEDIVGRVIGEHQYYIQRSIAGAVDSDTAADVLDIVESELQEAVERIADSLTDYVYTLLRRRR